MAKPKALTKGERKPTVKETEVAGSVQDAATILNYGEQGSRNVHMLGDRRALLTVGSSQVRVTVVIGEPMPQVATHNYRPGASAATITISGEARPQDITRAVAHEFAEIQMALEHPAAVESSDVLVKDSKKESNLSAHDEGRRAELKVLLYELKNQPQREAEIQSEIKKLIEHLGFDMATVNGDMRARRIFGDAAIAGLDTMAGRNRIYVKTEQITNAKPRPLRPDSAEWVLPFAVTIPGHPDPSRLG